MRINGAILFVIKLVIAFAAFIFVFLKLYEQGAQGFDDLFSHDLFRSNWHCLFFAIVLMPVGWSIEAFKWILSLKGIQKTTFVDSLKTIWYGVGVGLLTPNRIGEPIGRMAMVNPENRAKSGVMAVLCGASQQLATLFFGFIGMIILAGDSDQEISENLSNPFAVTFIIASIIIPLIFVLKVNWIAKNLNKIKYFKRLLSGESVDVNISNLKIISLVSLSLIRYAVFSTQFLFLLYFFGYDLSIVKAYSAIFATYLFASAVPSFAIGEAGVRTSFAIIFIGATWSNPTAIAFAAMSLWLLNVALPGLVGVWFLFSKR